MLEAKPPLFNRTYLKIIIGVVAVAIALLTAGQRSGPEFINIKKQPEVPLYYANVDQLETLELSFLLRTDVALNGEQQLLQQLLLQQVEQQLAGLTAQPTFAFLQATLSTAIAPDQLKIVITLSADHAAQTDAIHDLTKQLLQRLSTYQPDIGLEQRWARLEAAQYLNLKDPENRLLNHFGELISHRHSVSALQRFADIYHNSTHLSGITLTLKGPDSEALAQRLSALLSSPIVSNNRRHGSLDMAPTDPTSVRLPPQGNQTYRLTGLVLPGRQQPQFATELLTVQTLRQLIQRQSQLTARLIWKSLDKQGYLAMMLHGSSIDANSDLTPLMTTLLTQLDDALIDDTRHRLQNTYREQMESLTAQLNMLDTIAFYRLPTDYLSRFETTLDAVNNADVRDNMRHFLTSNERYQITLPAY
ncbi:hypothetical protein Q4488_15180 [Amphritea sp. 1_MG-2023]|uniref:hypothetical protein n=1 Tax=Amphritea sp. 1_MG-2023 TaxID=3062670 RepID=UPI0026E49186|nr:hypothetical protein [Amphritea sp. 1_MG-2023]MDO6564725.1 hypothetical protein [Amphritea sp. 1_MG-2023]